MRALTFLTRKIIFAIPVASLIQLSGCGADTSGKSENAGARLRILGKEQLSSPAKWTSIALNFTTEGVNGTAAGKVRGYECRVNNAARFTPCDGNPYRLSGLTPGKSHVIEARALLEGTDGTTATSGSDTATVTVASDAKPDNPSSSDQATIPVISNQLGQTVGLGGEFTVSVPKGFHVTEYTTTNIRGGAMSFRILPESDRNYPWVTACKGDANRRVQSLSPAGTSLSYCQSAPSPDDSGPYGEATPAARVEIATDSGDVSETNQEIITYSLASAGERSGSVPMRFWRLCAGRKISNTLVPMIRPFFDGDTSAKQWFSSCETFVNDASGQQALWKVGTFSSAITTSAMAGSGSSLGGSYDHGSEMCPLAGLTVIYAAKPRTIDMLSDHFAKRAQQRVQETLGKSSNNVAWLDPM